MVQEIKCSSLLTRKKAFSILEATTVGILCNQDIACSDSARGHTLRNQGHIIILIIFSVYSPRFT